MKRIKITRIFLCLVLTALLSASVAEPVFSCGCSRGMRSHSSIAFNHPVSPAPFFYPPPPGFPEKWFVKDAMDSITKNGLKIDKVRKTTKAEYTSLPARAGQGIRFTVSSHKKTVEGYIFSFHKKDNIEKVQKYFLELNTNGELYTWSFVKDNILLIIDGSLPESMAKHFESALYDLKDKGVL